MADKKGRVQEIIQRDVSEIILYDLKSPLCRYASINEVRMTSDYSYCKFYVTHMNPELTDVLVSYLNTNAKKIRSLLSKKLSIYKTPELAFYKDEVYEKARHIDLLIEKALSKKPVTLKDLEEKEKKAKSRKTPAKKK
ncbi:MAG TPA: 30S ribosome-binding factor RbfA [Candidatus Enterosoma merdigallinarum]|nr:30S ribosome-binding factor RbfA [Candidatus Enterosoma merdigallinarum]